MFTVHAIQSNGRLSHKEHLNNDELNDWMDAALEKHDRVRIIQDLTGKSHIYGRAGEVGNHFWMKLI